MACCKGCDELKLLASAHTCNRVAAEYPEAIDIAAQMDRDQRRKFGTRRTYPPRLFVPSEDHVRLVLRLKAYECERNLGKPL